MRKISVVVINRANYARIKTVLELLSASDDIELSIIAGGSTLLERFGKATEVMRKDGFSPETYLYSVVEGDTPGTMAKSTGLAMIELSSAFERLAPDVVLTVADRYETLATAATASYMNIPVAHTQGGEVSGSIDESVRHAVTKLANIHFPATERAEDFLLRMGESKENVHLAGCPSIDLVNRADLSLPEDFFVSRGGVGAEIEPSKPYLVVMQHPVTTEFGSAQAQIDQTLEALAKLIKRGFQVVWLWPNIDAGSDSISQRLRAFREEHSQSLIRFYKNFEPEDFLRLIKNSSCLVGNSSSGLRESAFLGLPVVNIGSRQHLRERGPNVTDVGHDSGQIYSAIEFQLNRDRYPRSLLFGDGTAGKKIAKVLGDTELKIGKTLSYLQAKS